MNEDKRLKRGEEELRESEEKYRNLVERANDGICIIQDGLVKYANTRQAEMWGGPVEEIIDTPFVNYIHSDELPMVIDRYNRRMAGEQVPSVYEAALRRKDGSKAFAELNIGIINYLGKPAELVITRDLTERKWADEALRQSEDKFSKAFHATSNLMGISTIKEGRIIDINEAYARLTGYTREEVIGHTSLELNIWADPEQRKMAIQKLQKEGLVHDLEVGIRTKSGEIRYVLFSADTITLGGEPCLITMAIDVTEHKRLKEKLAEERQDYRLIVDSSPVLIFYKDKEGRLLRINKAFAEALEIPAEKVLGKTAFDLYPTKIAQRMTNDDQEVLKSGRPKLGIMEQVEQYESAKGTRWVQTDKVPILDKNGTPIGLVGLAQDITERKRAEEALRRSEENFRRTLEESPLGIRIVNTDGETLYVNQALPNIYGCASFEDFKQIPIKKRYTPESYLEFQLRKEKRTRGEYVPSKFEVGAVRKDGQIRHLEVWRKEVLWDDKTQYQMICQDITERVQLETERRRIEKLESVGTLAGGIAHDFNNLLTGIMGNISLARRYVEPKGKAAERLEEAEKASIRARDLTQQLLTFSRGGAPIKTVIAIKKLIQESSTFALTGSKVKPEFYLPDDLWAVEADEGQINQVISNIVINADQAMPQGGIINIEADNLVTESRSGSSLPSGKYVHIAIKDCGIGIPREHLGTIFDPFFTTKQKGSGLGLATAYSIVKNHGGNITVKSELGNGTTFHIYLPASEKQAPVEEEEVVIETTLRGKGRILVMDDEETIRNILSDMLSLAGYEVELTRDGAETIERYAEAKGAKKPFDAVVMDLTISGGMGGKEAIVKMLEIDPDAKVIVSSGYANDPIMSEYKKYGFSAVVTKPYNAAKFERTLDSVLRDKK